MDVAFAVPDVPILLYNIPMRTGNSLLPETVARLAEDAPNIVGVKDSSGDFYNILAYYNQTRNLSNKEFYVLSGNDSLILSTLMAGGAGAVAGCSNVYPKVLSSIYELFIQGKLEECRAAQESIASFRECFKYGNPNTIVKIAVRLLGYDVGECRKPFTGVSEEGMNKIKQVLEENKKEYELKWRIKPIIGITMGDPSGNGPELCVKALIRSEIEQRCHCNWRC